MTRKIMTIHKSLRPGDDRDYIYEEEKRKLAHIENNVDALIQGLDDYIKKHKRRIIVT